MSGNGILNSRKLENSSSGAAMRGVSWSCSGHDMAGWSMWVGQRKRVGNSGKRGPIGENVRNTRCPQEDALKKRREWHKTEGNLRSQELNQKVPGGDQPFP
jgi:hypothetical protein